jgi:hypothetical protein
MRRPLLYSRNITQQLGLQDELPLLVLLARLECLVILPPNGPGALSTFDIPHYVSTSRHIALAGLAGHEVDYALEEVRLAMLAAEIL